MNTIHKDYDPGSPEAKACISQPVGVRTLHPSPTNPRKSFPEDSMAALTDNVRQVGILQPLLVRLWPAVYPWQGDMPMYEIVCGERRYRAAKAAGLFLVPALVRDLSNREVVKMQAIENLQREDLHPLEEAEGYDQMLHHYGYTVEQLVKEIDKSRSYIFGRLKLLALDDDARRLFRAGLLNPSTALLVARIPTAGLRAKAIKDISETDYRGDVMSVRAAQRHIQQRYMLKLAEAPFPVGDATLTPAGSCEACPKRTGNCRDLFDDIESPDVCTDPDCFAAKKIAQRDREAAKAAAAGVTVIVGEAAKKIAGTDYSIEHTTLKGFTQLDKICYDDPEDRTYAEILGDNVEHALLEDTYRQVMVPVIDNKILAEKLQAAGVKLRAQEAAKSNAKVEAKLAIERATRERLVEIIREETQEMVNNDATLPYEEMNHILNLVTQRMWERLWQDTGFKIANLWGAEGKNNTERAKAFGLSIPTLSTGDCWRLLVDMLIGGSATVNSEYDLEHGGGVLMTMAESVFGIDADQTRKVVTAQIKAKEAEKVQSKTAKSKKKTAKPTPPDTPAEPPYPSEAARAADSTRENAAQAAETSAEEKSETPSAGADIIEKVEEPSQVTDDDTFAIGDLVRVKNDVRGPNGQRRKCCGREGKVETVQGAFFSVRFGAKKTDVVANLVWNEIEKVATPSAPAIDEAQRPDASGEGIIETEETPPAPESQSADQIHVGDCIRIRSTCKHWQAAGQEALITLVVRPGIYKAKYGPAAGDVVALVDDDIITKLPYGLAPEWSKEPAPSAPVAAVEKYQPSNATEGDFFFDSWCRRCSRDKAMLEGLAPLMLDDDEKCSIIGDTMLYKIDSPNYPSEWRYGEDGEPCCTAFVPVGDPIPAPRCDKTVDMFQEPAA